MATETINKVAKLMADFATSKGISLQEEFGTKEEFHKFVIAITFKTLKEGGLSTDEAFGKIFGDGKYDELVENTWNRLQETA